jgi:hypothetical protein
MVNQVILKYFKDNIARHSLEDLKAKVLSAGYSREDMNEAVIALKESIDVFVAPNIKQEEIKVVKKSGGFKWMMFSGFLGFGLLGLILVFFIVSFFYVPTYDVLSSDGNLFLTVFSVFLICIFLGFGFFYLYGFFRLGKHVESKLIVISSLLSMVALVISVLLFVVSFVFIGAVMNEANSYDFNVAPTGEVIVTENVVADENFGFDLETLAPFIIIFIIFFVFVISLWFMFSVGLVNIRKKIGFAGIAGYLGLFISTLTVFVFCFSLLVVIDPVVFFRVVSSDWFYSALRIYGVLFGFLSFIMIAFCSMILLGASKKYEK